MRLIGYILTSTGILSMFIGIIARIQPDVLKGVPLDAVTSSSFMHFANTLFLASMALMLLHIAERDH